MWSGGLNGQLLRWDAEKGKLLSGKDVRIRSPTSSRILPIYSLEYVGGKLYVGTGTTIVMLDTETRRVKLRLPSRKAASGEANDAAGGGLNSSFAGLPDADTHSLVGSLSSSMTSLNFIDPGEGDDGRTDGTGKDRAGAGAGAAPWSMRSRTSSMPSRFKRPSMDRGATNSPLLPNPALNLLGGVAKAKGSPGPMHKGLQTSSPVRHHKTKGFQPLLDSQPFKAKGFQPLVAPPMSLTEPMRLLKRTTKLQPAPVLPMPSNTPMQMPMPVPMVGAGSGVGGGHAPSNPGGHAGNTTPTKRKPPGLFIPMSPLAPEPQSPSVPRTPTGRGANANANAGAGAVSTGPKSLSSNFRRVEGLGFESGEGRGRVPSPGFGRQSSLDARPGGKAASERGGSMAPQGFGPAPPRRHSASEALGLGQPPAPSKRKSPAKSGLNPHHEATQGQGPASKAVAAKPVRSVSETTTWGGGGAAPYSSPPKVALTGRFFKGKGLEDKRVLYAS